MAASEPNGRAGEITGDLFRREGAKLVATLTAHLGTHRLQLAEDTVQEALMRALQIWPYRGVPDNPAAWLMQTAKNLALDALRREQNWREKQEGIAACHATAASAEATDWPRIVGLYEHLLALTRSPIVALNRAIALARVHGPQSGLDALAAVRGLDDYLLLDAARGTLALEAGQRVEALASYRRAETLATLPSEREFIARRIREWGEPT